MIQRIQTLYLFFSLLCLSLLFVFPLWAGNSTSGMNEIGANTHLLLAPVVLIMMLVNLVSIFLFKKRKVQMIICRTTILLNVIFLGLAFLFVHQEQNLFDAQTLKSFKPGLAFPFLSIAFTIMAIQKIKADEKLVRDMDRLR